MAIDKGTSKDILELCDRFRDQDLVNIGVQLDDGQGAGTTRRLISTDVNDADHLDRWRSFVQASRS